MAYCTFEEFEAYVSSEITGNQEFLADVLAATEDAVNDYCGRAFDNLTTPITRTYVPHDDVVEIHDISDTAGIVILDNGAAVALTDVQFEPTNTVTANGLTTPKFKIRRLSTCWTPPILSPRQATVSVTSTHWGWAAVPPQVKQATLILGKDIAHVRANRFGVAGFGEFGVVRVRDNPHVVMLLQNLRHPSAFGIA
jgi:hypothetical protein